MLVATDSEGTVFTACENGHGKRTPLAEYPVKNRGGQGVINIRTEGRNGPVKGFDLAVDGDEVLFITESGMIVRSPVSSMRPMGRGTQGVRLVNLKSGDKLVGAEIVRSEDLEISEAEEELAAAAGEGAPSAPSAEVVDDAEGAADSEGVDGGELDDEEGAE